MIDPTSLNLKIDHTNEIVSTNKRKSNLNMNASCSSQKSKGRMALKAFLLHDSIDSHQLKQKLEETAASRPKVKKVNFNLSKNLMDYLPNSHSTKKNWYSESDYVTFEEETRECVRLAIQNDPLFDHSQDSNSSKSFSSALLSSSKKRLARLYLDSLLRKGDPGNIACFSRNWTVRALLEQGWGDSDLILRGLESYLLPDMRTFKKFYRKNLVQYYNNTIRNHGNDSQLRSLSIKMTKASIEFARLLGCIDAVVTEKIMISF